MTTFDRREEAFENLFAHDEELHFKAKSRCTKLLAGWAAGRMGRTGPAAEDYAQSIVAIAVANGSDDALVKHIHDDLQAAGVTASDVEIRAEMDRLMTESLAAVRRG